MVYSAYYKPKCDVSYNQRKQMASTHRLLRHTRPTVRRLSTNIHVTKLIGQRVDSASSRRPLARDWRPSVTGRVMLSSSRTVVASLSSLLAILWLDAWSEELPALRHARCRHPWLGSAVVRRLGRAIVCLRLVCSIDTSLSRWLRLLRRNRSAFGVCLSCGMFPLGMSVGGV